MALLGEESDEDDEEDEDDDHVAEDVHGLGGGNNKVSSTDSEEESKDEESSEGDNDSSEESSEEDDSDGESASSGAGSRARVPSTAAIPVQPRTTPGNSKINGKAGSVPLGTNGTTRGGGVGSNTTATEAKRKSVGTPSVASRHPPQAPSSGHKAVPNRWR